MYRDFGYKKTINHLAVYSADGDCKQAIEIKSTIVLIMVIPCPCAFSKSLNSTKSIKLTQNVHSEAMHRLLCCIRLRTVHKTGPL